VAKLPPAAAKPVPAVAGGGTLRVNSRPWSQVFVDGKLVGNTPQMAISLSPGSHKLKLVSPDLGLTKQMTVQVDKGKVTTKVVNLIE
jgi:serine/threonine-protein kinase